MKKIHKHLKSEADFVARPFALRDHLHQGVYLPLSSAYPVTVDTDIIFTGTLIGLPGVGAAEETIIAGEDLSALRIISSSDSGTALYSDPADPDSTRRIIGLTTGAALTGTGAPFLQEGRYQDASWNWDVTKRLFLGVNGTITQVAPTTGISVVLGHASKPDTIFLNVDKPIALI